MKLNEILEADNEKIEKLADLFIYSIKMPYEIKQDFIEEIFGKLKFAISFPEVNTLTPFGNQYVMSVKYNLNGLDLGFYINFLKNADLSTDVKPKFIEMFIELKNHLKEFNEYLSQFNALKIMINKTSERLIKPRDSQRLYERVPVHTGINQGLSISDGFSELKSSDIKTYYPFPKKDDLHYLQQYIMVSPIPEFTKKENYNYLINDIIFNSKKHIVSVLEILIQDTESKELKYNISHYSV